MARPSIQERFWSKVQKTDTCWLWSSHRNKHGYGSFWYADTMAKAHRVAYVLAYGPIPEGLCVLHQCDVTSCVNPSHLFLGTQAENVADRQRKGRQARLKGEASGPCKITTETARKILHGTGLHQDIADAHGVSRALVSAIKNRRVWRHI